MGHFRSRTPRHLQWARQYSTFPKGFSEVELVRMISEAGFQDTETVVVDRESTPPYFQTLLATAAK